MESSAAQNFITQCGIGALLQRVPHGGLDSSSAATRVAVANPLPLMTKAELQAELRDFGLNPGSEQSLDALAKMVWRAREGQPREVSSPAIPRTHSPTDVLRVQSLHPNGPAFQSRAIDIGDVIIEIDGVNAAFIDDLDLLGSAGTEVTLKLLKRGASRPTKVTLERLPFQHWIQENDRHAIDEISKLYQTAHYTAQDYKGNEMEFFVDRVLPRSSDYNQHQAAYELNRTLGLLQDSGIQNMRNYERRYTSSMAETYPNVLNQAGTSDAAWSKPFEEDFAFRELPNGGRRSPRSHLFCHLVACNAAPYVPKLSHAEACSNSVASGDESDSLYGIDVSSDSDANEFLRDEGYDLPAQLIRDLCETSLSSMSSRPRADILAELLSPAERADCIILYNMCPPDEYCDEMRSIVEEHFAGGGSSNSALLNARLGAIEDQYLAAEVEEEAIDDLQCALQRLREGINECDTDPAQSPNINSLCTAQCSNHQQVQEYC